ncbi:MAG: alpha/beta fold hydrolase [Armatimonadota bacterium]
MRARLPDRTGYAVNAGVRIYYEACGDGDPAVLFVPGAQVVHGRAWKMQVPFLAHHYRTVVYDPRGAGKSDRPATDYGKEALVGDALAVVDDLSIDRFSIVAISGGARPAIILAARHPLRVASVVLIGGSLYPHSSTLSQEMALQQRRARMLGDFDGWVQEFWTVSFPEPHSTKPYDDGCEYTHATDVQTLVATGEHGWSVIDARPEVDAVRCPVLLIHGTKDARVRYVYAEELLRLLPQANLVTVVGGGHFPMIRDPVRVNLLIREFLAGLDTPRVPSAERLRAAR